MPEWHYKTLHRVPIRLWFCFHLPLALKADADSESSGNLEVLMECGRVNRDLRRAIRATRCCSFQQFLHHSSAASRSLISLNFLGESEHWRLSIKKTLPMTVNIGPPNSSSYTRILRSAASESFRDFHPGATEPLKKTAYDIISMFAWITSKPGEAKKREGYNARRISGCGCRSLVY